MGCLHFYSKVRATDESMLAPGVTVGLAAALSAMPDRQFGAIGMNDFIFSIQSRHKQQDDAGATDSLDRLFGRLGNVFIALNHRCAVD